MTTAAILTAIAGLYVLAVAVLGMCLHINQRLHHDRDADLDYLLRLHGGSPSRTSDAAVTAHYVAEPRDAYELTDAQSRYTDMDRI